MAPTRTRRSSTEETLRRVAAIACAACALALGAVPAAAGELHAEGTPGLRLWFPQGNLDDPDLTDWFDRYEQIRHRSAEVPWWIDALHLDVGWMSDPETWLARLERWSLAPLNERSLFDLDWRGVAVEGGFQRQRVDELRLTPRGTGQDGEPVLPRLGSFYTDGTDPDDVFFVRRTGGGGRLALRPDGFGEAWPLLRQVTIEGWRQLRVGRRQDRFLLDPLEIGGGPAAGRFRGVTRPIDQSVTTLATSVVLEPGGLFTSVLGIEFERFRESTDLYTVADLAAQDPIVEPAPGAGQNTIGFVPDTNRWTGAVQVARRIGPASLHGGAAASRLAQTGTRTPAQRTADLDDNHVTTLAAGGAANVPLGEHFALDLWGRWDARENGLERGTALFAGDDGSQLGPFLSRLARIESGAELVATPFAGTRAALGWRLRSIDRDLDYPDATDAAGLPLRTIQPQLALVEPTSRTHTLYLESHARLLRRLRLAGELGFAWSPEVGLPREPSHARYLRLRASQTFARPLPTSLSLFGSWRDADGDGVLLESATAGRSARKELDVRRFSLGVTASVVPAKSTALFGTCVWQREKQDFPYVRSNVPRFQGVPFVRFYLDSLLAWRGDLRVLALGGTRALTDRIDLGLGSSLAWVGGRFQDGGASADVLDGVNRIDVTIASLDAGLTLRVRDGVRVGIGWRSESYHDGSRIDEPDLNGWRHGLLLSTEIDFGALRR